MDPQEIARRVADFPRWHYRIDLGGVETPIAEPRHVNRHLQRRRYFFEPLVRQLGGSLQGRRILDLGCNAGFWSLAAIDHGCDYVLGIDGRAMHIEQANLVFEAREVSRNRYDFLKANLFEVDFGSLGEFDVVLCLGLMYHTSKPMELMERIDSVNTDALVIDTTLFGSPGSLLHLKHEILEDPRSGVDHALVGYPTRQAILDLAGVFGYRVWTLKPRFTDYTGALDYRFGMRRAFLCAKKSSFAGAGAMEVNSLGRQLLDPWRYLAYIVVKRLLGGRV